MKSIGDPQLDPSENIAVGALSVFELAKQMWRGAGELQATLDPVPVSGPGLRH